MSNNNFIDNINPAKLYSSEIYAKAKKYQKQYGFKMGSGKHDTWNNEADAFKHAFMQADLALKTTVGLSKIAGDRHEKDGKKMSQPLYEENMDLWNNKVGRDIAQEIQQEMNFLQQKAYLLNGKMNDIIASKIIQRMKNGDLITDPFKDKRQFKDYGKYFRNKNQDKPTGQAAPVNNIYTREMIGKMTADEYLQNEPMIMEQLKTQGGIPNEKQLNQQNDLSGFINQISGNSNIFTREDIKNMSADEYLKNEKAIDFQLKTIGIPSQVQANQAVQSGGMIYVQPYTRADGTSVKGYYRSVR